MKTESAGLLMHRTRAGELEVLLVHPGGPWWRTKDVGAWTIPKGGIEPGENPLAAAEREFQEELGIAPSGPYISLGNVKQKAGKVVHAWAFSGDCDPASISSNLVKIEWPPRTGKMMEIPEVDRAEFFHVSAAIQKINPAQMLFLERLEKMLVGKS